ncbi:1500_t:CDS:1, partial [Paraglomus occultum]
HGVLIGGKPGHDSRGVTNEVVGCSDSEKSDPDPEVSEIRFSNFLCEVEV